MRRLFKKQGWTNIVYFINLVLAWLYTQECVILSVLGDNCGIEDYSFVAVGLPLVWAEVSVFSGFIVWKNKAENCRRANDTERLAELANE